MLAGLQVVADADRLDCQLQALARPPGAEHRDVAAVGIDVQVVGVQVPDRIVVMRLAPNTGARSLARNDPLEPSIAV